MISKNSKTESSLTQPTVSVLVPSYNHAPFIEQCLTSIFKQTRPPDKLLVIDDGSKDNSTLLIEKLLQQCKFPCELIVRSNKGLCATLNEGFEKLDGDYFAYLGSDDLWLPEFLKARVRLLESRPEAILGYGHAYFIDHQNRIFDNSEDWAQSVYVDGDASQMLYQGFAPISSSVFYRRSALRDHRWNEQSKLEDYEFYLGVCRDGEFAFDKQIYSAWRWHSHNTGNVEFFLEQCLKAQERCAPLIGWEAKELDKIQKKLRFRYVEEFLREGNKYRACQLYLKNLGGASSLKNLGRTTLRLLIPQFITNGWRRSVRNSNFEKYKNVKLS